MWKALKSDRTLMLGLDGVEDGHSRPMTVQIEGDSGGPLWFFTSNDNAMVKQLGQGHRAIAAFSAKNHELFASLKGNLRVDNDRAVIERLWNPFIAAWFEGGKDDPTLRLLRMDPEETHVWLNENSLLAGVKLMLGVDPKRAYEDKTGDIDIG